MKGYTFFQMPWPKRKHSIYKRLEIGECGISNLYFSSSAT